MEHPTEEALRRFLLVETSRQENRKIVRHFLARCPPCAAAVMKMRKGPPVEPVAYDEVLNRFMARLRELAGGSTPRRVSG